MRNFLLFLGLTTLVLSCSKNGGEPGPDNSNTLYFPPVSGSEWQTTDMASLGWNEGTVNDLYTYLEQKNSKAFIVLKNGKIVIEKYFGLFTKDSLWYWASAGKTLTAFLSGISQDEGLIDLSDKTSRFLGNGWTSLPQAKEDLITIRHQLTMTTGLDDDVAPDNDCTDPACLQYRADAGTRWAYHNAPYTLMEKVIENASGTNYNSYFQQKVRDRIGMNGLWIKTGFNNVYYSNARSMARFGLLMLNKGKWDQTKILADTLYFQDQVNSSQNFNLSYGYLTWLNGKASHMLPTLELTFIGSMMPNAPVDMYAALGKNDQKIYVVPSQKLVVIRMGESAGNVQLALSSFDNELWGKLKTIIGY
ncbi:MAG: serine hydrolase domain-containing protein [Chitinophagaceae bacterium]|nr:serine hydrolase domain-containing protein [Chitinophagaceae bacterium]